MESKKEALAQNNGSAKEQNQNSIYGADGDKKIYMGKIEFEETNGKARKWMFIGISISVVIGVAVVVLSLCLTGRCESDGCDMKCENNLAENSIKWGYLEHNGASCWDKCFPHCASKIRQSPINFNSAEMTVVNTSSTLVLNDYQTEINDVTMNNNGHAVVLTPQPQDPLAVEGLGLPGKYIAAQMHWHWGSESSRGSEHTIDSRNYPLELHIVHFSANYSSFEEAQTQEDGLAVLGFLYEVTPTDNPSYKSIIVNLPNVKYAGQNQIIGSLRFADLIPDNMTTYYRYHGSLTSPPCLETVVWTVFTDTIGISEKQLSAFRELMANDEDSPKEPLVDTFRPPLDVGSRTVYFSNMP